ncbi:mechanosensitive ion channel family protein [Natrarchaeobaculum aegyptiacum]|uniref:mechanosensitive ion channel family protein n=1 Tax=Natrarchaeobaculum aegyptiacum TaxID=745377 RepID=UPI001E353C30|nr:mechanosensitive ion channel family protein [Natrarchaeobaculum aegyptiacum]
MEWLPGGLPEPTEFGIAFVVLVIGWFLSKLVVRLAGRTVARRIERPSVTRSALRGIRATVLVITLAVVAAILGFSGTSILLSVTVISAVVAVVLAPLVGSFINGLFVLADQPYEIGDMIEIVDEGHRGFVEDITIRYTKIFTLENTFIVIPNSEIQQRDVVNYSAEDERTRLSITFEITYESDLEAARRGAARAARQVDNVITGGPEIRIGSARYPASPTCTVAEYADDGIVLELYVWLQHPYNQTRDLSAVRTAVRERFQSLDVEFAYPHRHHVFDETSGVPALTGDGGEFVDAPADAASPSGSDSDLSRNPDADAESNPDST